MVIHEFVCEDCGHRIETQDTSGHICPECGADMYWDLSGVNRGQRGDYRLVSDSLAISPEQIAEHRQLFPDVEVLPDGRPEFTSVRQHEKYLDKTGFYKRPQKIRSRL